MIRRTHAEFCVQVVQCLLTGRIWNRTKSGSETFDRRLVCTMKLVFEHLAGDVEPGEAICRKVGKACLLGAP